MRTSARIAGRFAAFVNVGGGVFSVGFLLAGLIATGLIGCGTPSAPTAPSLQIPDPTKDLTAVRTGDQVTLSWTMPKRSTDKLMLRGPQKARLVRIAVPTSGAAPGNEQIVAQLSFNPATVASYVDKLPPDLASGPLRQLSYRVELQNHQGKSAGSSNAAYTAAGSAPSPLTGLTATSRAEGVVLHWPADAGAPASPAGLSGVESVVRIRRRLNPDATNHDAAKTTPKKSNAFNQPAVAEQADQTLIVKRTQAAGALDESAALNRNYSYTAEHVYNITLAGHTIAVAGLSGPPVTVATVDVFPPQPPAELAAVAVPGQDAIDLSWSPNTEPDLAGYKVYRREDSADWTRISSGGDMPAPEFRDTTVAHKHHYSYAVTAIDRSGNESARSGIAEETLP